MSGSLAVNAQIDHYESVVLEGDEWTYTIPDRNTPLTWIENDFEDSNWLSGPSGIGYGDEDDHTVVNPTISVFMRNRFEIFNVEDIQDLILDIDFDDGFVAYLNGVEIARSLLTGTPPAYDQFSDTDREARLYTGGIPERFIIDTDLLLDGQNILAVQVHNWSTNSSDMSCIPFLSVGLTTSEQQYRPLPEWFRLPEQTVELESSNLPIVIIDTENAAEIPDEPKIKAYMRIIAADDGSRNYMSDQNNASALNYEGNIEIEYRGATTSLLPKKQYAITTYDAEGEKENVSILGMPNENDWILNGLGYDPSYLRDYITYKTSRIIGEYAPRGVYCEVILNGDYRGLYVMQERIKIDNDRVDLRKLDASDIDGEDVTGGYIVKADKIEGDDFLDWSMPNSSGWNTNFVIEKPKRDEITNEQKEYIREYFLQLARAASNDNPEDGYPSLIDIPSFVDFMILSELASNPDAYEFSTFFHKDKNSKLRAGALWDINLSYGNDLFQMGFDRSKTDVWQFDDGGNTGARFWRDLFRDNTFRCIFSRRWLELTAPGQPLHQKELFSLIDEVVAYTEEARGREMQKWLQNEDYDSLILQMKTWITKRIGWMTNNLGNGENCTGNTVPNLMITKIHYHPKEMENLEESKLEFFEITNFEDAEVDLTGYYLGKTGLSYQFPIDSKIEAGESLLIANDKEDFMSGYGYGPFDEFTRSLSNKSETIQLLNAYGTLVDEVTYYDSDPWPIEADGEGYFIYVLDPSRSNDNADNWGIMEQEDFQIILQVNTIEELNIYPNPAETVLNISSKHDISAVQVIDMNGKVRDIDVYRRNENNTADNYPSSYTNVISVGASQSDSVDAFWMTHYGKKSVDLIAPGVHILSSVPRNGGMYAYKTGTSMASPFVAGAVGLLIAYNPYQSIAWYKSTLLRTVWKHPALTERCVSGGHLDLTHLIKEGVPHSRPVHAALLKNWVRYSATQKSK